ncbi:Hpt domain-containing protein [Shimia sp. MMG029]|uniref:Hpt domain-containing protein n=1 Tax=Shimia sp. MMG029 TaxID=3021978 RepID=UPI0022FEDC43|nr:Hpt domain-containing protein [Shimia sp. MMG029]MDA5556376.1 Hpt domain-containing protein [Shimia sp. MMG029]
MLPSKYKKKLAGLRRRFLAGLPAREAEIEDLTATLLEHGPMPNALKDLYIATHKLAGTSGTYGLSALSLCAEQVEQLLEPAQQRRPTEPELVRILVATDILSEKLSDTISAG